MITILHPWESGLDNSPIWDEPLSRIKIKKENLTKFQRKDITAVGGAAEVRPSDSMYNRFIYLIELMKKYDYDERKVYETIPFKIKDIVFNSILFVANKFLIKIAEIVEQKNDIKKIKNGYRICKRISIGTSCHRFSSNTKPKEWVRTKRIFFMINK